MLLPGAWPEAGAATPGPLPAAPWLAPSAGPHPEQQGYTGQVLMLQLTSRQEA